MAIYLSFSKSEDHEKIRILREGLAGNTSSEASAAKEKLLNLLHGVGFNTINERSPDRVINEGKQLIKIKIEQELAKQYGIINEFNHSDFKQTLKQKNSRRIKAVENKQIIHGPIHYSEEFYYGYVHNNMVLALKEVMGKELFNFTDKMYQSCYEGNREALFKKFKAKNRILSEYEEFSEYKELNGVNPYIKQILIDKEYEKLITEKILTAEIKIVTNNFDMYIIKDIFN